MSLEIATMEDETFRELIRRVQGGSQEAAWDLVAQFSDEIQRIVRRRLPLVLRAKFDPDDYVQATWLSVFKHRSRLAAYPRPQQFFAFVAKVATRKVAQEIRRRVSGKKYNAFREEPLQTSLSQDARDPVSPTASPSALAIAREHWFLVLKSQPLHYQQMVQLRFEGHTYAEIAMKLGCDEKTVREAIKRVFKRQRL